MAAVRYMTWNDEALAAKAADIRKIDSPSMADRGRLGRINAELARRTPEHQRPNDWMESGYWLEHAAGPDAKGSPDTITRKPNRLLAVYRRWLGAGFDEAIGYADPLWRVEVDRRATVAKDRSTVMGQIQRQEFQHFERSYAQRVLNAMPPEAARTRTDADIRRAARKVASDPAAPTDAARDLRRVAMANAAARAVWGACEAAGRDLHDDLERAIFDVTRKWVVARKRGRAGAPGPWLLEQRESDPGLVAAIRVAAGLPTGWSI